MGSRLTTYTRKTLDADLEVLRRECPVHCPVDVRLVYALSHYGDCTHCADPERFVVRLRAGLTVLEGRDTLVHEWAHAMDWRPARPYWRDHSPSWGVCYADAYCALFGTS